MNRLCRVAVGLLTLASIGSWTAATSSATPISTALSAPNTGSEFTPFPVSSTDIGQTQGTWSIFSGTAAFGSSVSELNDGNKYGGLTIANTLPSFTPAGGTVAILTFGKPVNVNSIVSLTGNSDDRNGQAYTLQYSTDGVNFNPLHTVGGEPNNSDASFIETQVTIADSLGGFLALNVQALRFTFSNVGVNGQSVYREIDVFGEAVPEPSSLALLGMAACLGLSVACLRRRRQRV